MKNGVCELLPSNSWTTNYIYSIFNKLGYNFTWLGWSGMYSSDTKQSEIIKASLNAQHCEPVYIDSSCINSLGGYLNHQTKAFYGVSLQHEYTVLSESINRVNWKHLAE
jgi:hypothetical protein